MACYIHPKHLPSREDLLALVPTGGSWAEVGVFDGSFSSQILEMARPSRLLLIDLWADAAIFSGDVNGQNVREINGRELEKIVRQRFANYPNVEIRRGTSELLSDQPESSMDAIYVDADHGYRSVRRDLFAAFRVLKDGGWLLGHDYGVNPEKTDARWEFDVQAAVDDFCRDARLSIHAFGMDGCTSFAIQIRKESGIGSRVYRRMRVLRTDAVRGLSHVARRVTRQ